MDGMDETIQFISFRDVILTVKSKLLGADLKDTIDWIYKNFYPSNERHRLMKIDTTPAVFVISMGEIKKSKNTGMTRRLLNILSDHPDFFQEACYDTHAFHLKRLNDFFSEKGIDIVFQKTNINDISIKNPVDTHQSSSDDEKSFSTDKVKEDVLFLRKFREDDPLALAIEIRNKEWARYIHDDKATRANQESIIADLKSRGLSTKQAECIELVACPIKR